MTGPRVVTLPIVIAAIACASPTSRPGGLASSEAFSSVPTAPKKLELGRAAPSGAAEPAPVLRAMQTELSRSMTGLAAKGDPPPYFLAYEVTDRLSTNVSASFGALVTSTQNRSRSLDVDLRVGDPTLDNTHPVRDDRRPSVDHSSGAQRKLPLEDEPGALRTGMWLATEQAYRGAVERYTRVKANRAVMVREEDTSNDFSSEEPVDSIESTAELTVDPREWETLVRDLAALFSRHPKVLSSRVSLYGSASTRYLANSEGSRIQEGRTHVRLSFGASAKGADGMRLSVADNLDAADLAGLPDRAVIEKRIETLIDTVLSLRDAPLAEPYVGPAILEGRAAGVFFHEIFGHRVEGHRQKSEAEGQTFAKKIGQQIMPTFVTVYDDPTLTTVNDIFLNGHYRHDDEAVSSQRATLVDSGILRGFLLSRSPIRGFTQSNGHGRRQPGRAAVARQGNLIVDPSQTTTRAGLTELLIDEVRRQGKPYGLRFADIRGGYTMTRRAGPQAFKVIPVVVYRVFPDGREELIRGVDLEGTPLTSLSQIVAASNDFAVFNGYCGAESGSVPVSATSPSLLVAQVEVARKKKSQDKPPILEPPPTNIVGRTP